MPTYYTATDRRCKTSALEQQILDQLQAAGLPVVPQVKRRSWVFDAALQDTWILIEVNGAYWHAKPHAKARDVRKAAWCQEVGYTLITIHEEDYLSDPVAALAPVIAAYRAAQSTGAPPIPKLVLDTEEPPMSSTSSEPGDWTSAFLAKLSETGIVLDACEVAHVTRQMAYLRRESDPRFKDAWRMALQDAADVAMRVYRQRGMEQSDRALEFFMRSRDPETFQSDQVSIHIQINWSLVPDPLLEQFRAGRLSFDALRPYAANTAN